MTDILQDLQWRGLIVQSTDLGALADELAAGPVTLYAGFDPTADSLHVGHLVPLVTLRRFQEAGHRSIVVAGGATGLIGDPSGRSTERQLLTGEEVAARVERIRPQLMRFLDFSGPAAARLVDNLEWTEPVTAIEFLRDLGKHFPVSQMLAKESVATRLGGGLSYTEFSYMLLQANDFLQLHLRHGCRLQIGGNDQWGNLTAGLDLIRKKTGARLHALTVPLLTTTTGEKFGKSTGGGAMWLDPELTSPYAWYQYWINADDQDVIAWLKIFSSLDRDEIEELEKATAERPAARAAQRRLAEELTTLVHGAEETRRVIEASQALFGRGDLAGLEPRVLGAALAEAGLLVLDGPMPGVAQLLKETGLAGSLSEARRTVDEGGAYVNNVRVADADAVPSPDTLLHGRWLVLRRGKRTVAGVAFGRE